MKKLFTKTLTLLLAAAMRQKRGPDASAPEPLSRIPLHFALRRLLRLGGRLGLGGPATNQEERSMIWKGAPEMKKLFTKTLTLLLAAAMLAGLCGCNSG